MNNLVMSNISIYIFKSTKKHSMGGAATNSGINYQQRVSAFVLVATITEFNLSYIFGIEEDFEIKSIHFETEDSVDDLKIICESKVIYLQIKRRISLESKSNSEFYKTIQQFFKQYINKKNALEYYVLATSPQSSNNIVEILHKITESIRLNENSLSENPWNQIEVQVISKIKKIFESLYKENFNNAPTHSEIIAFFKHIYISKIDIETNCSDERVVFSLLNSMEFSVDMRMIWNMLIVNCLEYAKKRQSVTRKTLCSIIKRFKVSNTTNKKSNKYENQLNFISVAKEVLLIKSFLEEFDLMLIELYRFSEDSKIKHQFLSNSVYAKKIIRFPCA